MSLLTLNHSFKTCDGPETFTSTAIFKKHGVRTSIGKQEQFTWNAHLEFAYQTSSGKSHQPAIVVIIIYYRHCWHYHLPLLLVALSFTIVIVGMIIYYHYHWHDNLQLLLLALSFIIVIVGIIIYYCYCWHYNFLFAIADINIHYCYCWHHYSLLLLLALLRSISHWTISLLSEDISTYQ